MKGYTSKVELTNAIKASYKKYIDEFEENDNSLNQEIIEAINKKIVMVKKALSKKYKTIYPLLEKGFEDNILELEGKIKKLNKKSTIKDIKNTFDLIKKIL